MRASQLVGKWAYRIAPAITPNGGKDFSWCWRNRKSRIRSQEEISVFILGVVAGIVIIYTPIAYSQAIASSSYMNDDNWIVASKMINKQMVLDKKLTREDIFGGWPWRRNVYKFVFTRELKAKYLRFRVWLLLVKVNWRYMK